MTSQQPPRMGRKPTHRLYRVAGDGESAVWSPIGCAWPNKDGKGFSLSLNVMPQRVRLVMRLVEARPQPTDPDVPPSGTSSASPAKRKSVAK